MNNPTTWANEALVGGAERKAVSAKRTAVWLNFALLLILIACAAGILERFASLGGMAEDAQKLTRWILSVAFAGGIVGALILVRVLATVRKGQNASAQRVKTVEQNWATASASLRSQIADERWAAERLQKQNA